ncbi:MAG: hypothetical protein KIB49_06130, partial [Clostridiales bacterium]|nr:hypothetical protein [Clostridiales bacterium]
MKDLKDLQQRTEAAYQELMRTAHRLEQACEEQGTTVKETTKHLADLYRQWQAEEKGKAETRLGTVKATVVDKAGDLKAAVQDKAADVKAKAEAVKEEAEEKLADAKAAAESKAEDAKEAVQDKAADVKTKAV